MSEIVVTKQFDTNESSDAIAARIQSEIALQFDSYSSLLPTTFQARVKTKLFNPIVSLNSRISVQNQEGKCTAMITADTKTNGWFWFTLIFMFVPPFIGWGFLLIGWMWFSQKKLAKIALENALGKAVFDLLTDACSKAQSGAETNSRMDTLEKLHKLKVDGAITEQEFKGQKSKLIA